MGNIGGLEILMVLVVALIVLGPAKLPEAARQIGKVVNEVRRVSSGFQRELREAIQDPIVEAEARARGAAETAKKAVDDATWAVTEPFQASSPPKTTPVEKPAADAEPAAEPEQADD